MKMITAIVQPFMLTKISHALESIERFPGLSITDVRGFGREKLEHDSEHHRRADDIVDFVKKSRIDIAAPDDLAEEIIRVIERVAHTGNRGDGKIFVTPLETAVRIRTGERDEHALSK